MTGRKHHKNIFFNLHPTTSRAGQNAHPGQAGPAAPPREAAALAPPCQAAAGLAPPWQAAAGLLPPGQAAPGLPPPGQAAVPGGTVASARLQFHPKSDGKIISI